MYTSNRAIGPHIVLKHIVYVKYVFKLLHVNVNKIKSLNYLISGHRSKQENTNKMCPYSACSTQVYNCCSVCMYLDCMINLCAMSSLVMCHCRRALVTVAVAMARSR